MKTRARASAERAADHLLIPLWERTDCAVAIASAPAALPQFASRITMSIMSYYACEDLDL